MVVKDKGLPLVPVALLSLFLALSVYYVVDRVARSAENSIPHTDNDNNNQNNVQTQKLVNPLAEILYQQLFMKKRLEMCPNFLKSVCKWGTDIPSDETTMTRNISRSFRKVGGVIVRSCQILGVRKYQDVCFVVSKNSSTLEMENDPNGRILLRILLQNCTHVNDNGFPCAFAERVPNEKHEKKNVCISDIESFSNIVSYRCRSQVSEENNKIIPIENVVFTVNEEKKNTSNKENAQEYKLGTNKSTVSTNATSFVCHILLAALLIVSASVALFEVCRDRLGDKKLGQQSVIGGDGRRSSNAWTGSPSSSPDSRRYSLADLAVSRHERKASIHLVQRAISFPVTTSPPTAPQKLLGARPPLLRRSSFPVHMNTACSGRVTPTSRSRRTSIDGNEGDSSPDVAKRRVRFIRRY